MAYADFMTELKTYLNIAADNTDYDNILSILLESAGAMLENYLGRDLLSGTHSQVLYKNGELMTPNVSSISSVKDEDNNDIDYEYSVDGAFTFIKLTNYDTYGYVEYEAGYNTSNFPADLKIVLFKLTAVDFFGSNFQFNSEILSASVVGENSYSFKDVDKLKILNSVSTWRNYDR